MKVKKRGGGNIARFKWTQSSHLKIYQAINLKMGQKKSFIFVLQKDYLVYTFILCKQ